MDRFFLLLLFAATAHFAGGGPANGALVVGGGMRDPAIFDQFLELAGGPDSPVVVIPPAAGEETYGLFYLLAPGDRFDLKSREATRGNEPAERAKEKPWND